MTENKPEEIRNSQTGYVTLPFNQDQFKDFIIGLLGKPQTITKTIIGNFEIGLDELRNFHNLINQRITQQNKGQLIQLKTKIYFSDKSTVLLSSYDELVSYYELKPAISVAVQMSWIYLIQFEDKKVPEKQEIELFIQTEQNNNIIESLLSPLRIGIGSGHFKITIQHSARTWGSDIEGLLTNQIESIIHKENKLKKYVRTNSTLIGIIMGLLILLWGGIEGYFGILKFNTSEITKVSEYMKSAGNNISSKADYIINYIAANNQNTFEDKSAIYGLVILLLAIILAVITASLANNKTRSYLLLTKEAGKHMHKCVKKQQKKWAWFIISIAVSIICGIISNCIFQWITNN